jgi:hypothetical protein
VFLPTFDPASLRVENFATSEGANPGGVEGFYPS